MLLEWYCFSILLVNIFSKLKVLQGCNIPDVDVVVQWKLPSSVSTFVQRAGRAARGHGRTGLAVLLVEKSVYEADLSRLDEIVQSTGKRKTVRQSSTYPKAPKNYAIERGVLRGGVNGTSDNNPSKADIPYDFDSVDEGLYTLVQTGRCRRQVLTAIYSNAQPHKFLQKSRRIHLLSKTRQFHAVICAILHF
jgi:superfamily II DNA/RNA helicase